MKVLAPISITSAMLTSSTVAEADHAEWAVDTAYTAGQKVIRLTTHKIYEALASTTGDTPETSPTKWLDLGATNRWKSFDQKVGTRSAQTSSMEWVIEPGQIVTAVAFLELVADSVRVQVSDADEGLVYDRTVPLTGSMLSADWYTYFLEPITRQTFAMFDDLPGYRSPEITVTVS
ncbi:MAG: hypothetical protein EOM03_18540, partial [Clostridia bacterium]|nr:hypothetical protein [Clostridia bacterium]